MEIREQDLAEPVGDHERLIKCIEQTGDQLKDLLVIGLRVYCRTICQTTLLKSCKQHLKHTSCKPGLAQMGMSSRKAMLAKPLSCVNGKCVLLCTMLEMLGS